MTPFLKGLMLLAALDVVACCAIRQGFHLLNLQNGKGENLKTARVSYCCFTEKTKHCKPRLKLLRQSPAGRCLMAQNLEVPILTQKKERKWKQSDKKSGQQKTNNLNIFRPKETSFCSNYTP